MKTMKMASCWLAVIPLLFAGVAAQGQTVQVTFDDMLGKPGYFKEWPGYYNSVNSGAGDVIGNPTINSMDVMYDSDARLLQKVVLNIASTQGSAAKVEKDVIVRWDSLFINTSYVDLNNVTGTGWDQKWDYFVHTNTTTSTEADGVVRGSKADIVGDVPSQGLYTVKETFEPTIPKYDNKGILIPGDYGYTMVSKASSGRKYHPDGIDNGYLVPLNSNFKGYFQSYYLSGAGNKQNWGYTITYDFTTLSTSGLRYKDGFTVGYTPWCANDVLLASVSDPVPEPATMLLFGSGLVGLAGLRRMRRK